jgi:hypothetical protein
MNIEVPHQVVFLDETWVYPKYGVMEIASLLRRGDRQQVGLSDVRFLTGQSGFWRVCPINNFGSDRTKKCPVLWINVKKKIYKLFTAKQHSVQSFMVQI